MQGVLSPVIPLCLPPTEVRNKGEGNLPYGKAKESKILTLKGKDQGSLAKITSSPDSLPLCTYLLTFGCASSYPFFTPLGYWVRKQRRSPPTLPPKGVRIQVNKGVRTGMKRLPSVTPFGSLSFSLASAVR